MNTSARREGETLGSFIAVSGLTIIYFLISILSLGGSIYAVSKASMVIWQGVKLCPDGLVCVVPDYLNPNAVWLAFGWTLLVLLISIAFPGLRRTSLLRGTFVIAMFGAVWIMGGFLVAVLRLEFMWSELSSAITGVLSTLAASALVIWHYRPFVRLAALVSILAVCFVAFLFFVVSFDQGTMIGLEIDLIAYVVLPALILTISVPMASVGLSWSIVPSRLGRAASIVISSASAWALFALTQVIFVVIWVWLGQQLWCFRPVTLRCWHELKNGKPLCV